MDKNRIQTLRENAGFLRTALADGSTPNTATSTRMFVASMPIVYSVLIHTCPKQHGFELWQVLLHDALYIGLQRIRKQCARHLSDRDCESVGKMTSPRLALS